MRYRTVVSRALAVATVVLLACQHTLSLKNERKSKGKTHDANNTAGGEDADSRPSLRLHDPHGNVVKHKYLRIRGGNLTDTTNFPFAAAIFVNGVFWCAGTIVDVNWVLTAAHCLNYVLHVSQMDSLKDFVKVRVGSPLSNEGGELVSVVGVVRHPKFEEEPAPHADVALLKLERNLEFNKYINLLRIYEGMKEPYAQSFISISGWGATNASETSFQEASPHLLSARLKVRTRSYCEDSYQLVNGFMFTSDLFCASLRNGSRDACLFDAGAPAIQNNRLMGVMSFGPERCASPKPAVFTKAFYFRDFVQSTISSYKTPADLVEAMAELQEDLAPEDNDKTENETKKSEESEELTKSEPKEEEAAADD